MAGETGQPDRGPTPAKVVLPPEEPPQPHVLEYGGPVQERVSLENPWYVRPAYLITCVAAGLLTLVGAVMLFMEFVHPSEPVAPLLMVLFGVAAVVWEYHAVSQRNRACVLCAGCVGLLVSAPLCLIAAEVLMQPSIQGIIPILMAIASAFCTVAHFLWAAQLQRPRSRPWRV